MSGTADLYMYSTAQLKLMAAMSSTIRPQIATIISDKNQNNTACFIFNLFIKEATLTQSQGCLL